MSVGRSLKAVASRILSRDDWKDEVLLALVNAVHLYIDWYWGLYLGAQVMEIAILFVYFWRRSERFPWVMPPALCVDSLTVTRPHVTERSG